jgi:hypothetical protein
MTADMVNAVYIVTEYAQGNASKRRSVVCRREDRPHDCLAVHDVDHAGGDLLTLLLSDVPLGWKFRVNIARGAASALVSSLLAWCFDAPNFLALHSHFDPTPLLRCIFMRRT